MMEQRGGPTDVSEDHQGKRGRGGGAAAVPPLLLVSAAPMSVSVLLIPALGPLGPAGVER